MKRTLTLSSLFLLAACGDDAAPAGDAALAQDLAIADLAGVDLAAVDLARDPSYPAGPYGNTAGATFPPLVWEGYVAPDGDVLANTKPYGAYTMNDARLTGRKYGVVHVSAFS